MTHNILLRNNVTVFGQGTQPILFAHGFGCDQNMWRFVTPAFEKDYKIVLFDYVGSGKSDLSAYSAERYSNLKGYAQDILDICTALELTDVFFVGHSVSSVIGILSSIQAPHLFDRLILVSPSPCYINDPPDYVGGFERQDIEDLLDIMDKNYIGWASFLAPVIMKNEDQPELTQELEASFCSTDPVLASVFAKTTFFSDNRSDLPKVTVPSLILQCTEDSIAPTEVGHYLHRHLSGSTLKLMKATGHCPHMSHPGETIDLIKEYLTAADIN
ncbi:alpha/beta hydrolase [Anabaena sphaerica FACHB-251]|uniref:Alpha/beta hydrolase n=2 Tax=Anabaena TaxID=1163 RepID=A0A926WGN4_9NOST|nr:alpha/beta hydrolase [Anabaena sphaerica FACHB-251]